ncbi:hypothetical protein KKC44_01790 [Patescibacteria group bacterium]|nr:hypothetical protein [Patescibacteria group bacterium]MBU2259314.1 hypothetical protein [Patescibacteria group bacterium]
MSDVGCLFVFEKKTKLICGIIEGTTTQKYMSNEHTPNPGEQTENEPTDAFERQRQIENAGLSVKLTLSFHDQMAMDEQLKIARGKVDRKLITAIKTAEAQLRNIQDDLGELYPKAAAVLQKYNDLTAEFHKSIAQNERDNPRQSNSHPTAGNTLYDYEHIVKYYKPKVDEARMRAFQKNARPTIFTLKRKMDDGATGIEIQALAIRLNNLCEKFRSSAQQIEEDYRGLIQAEKNLDDYQEGEEFPLEIRSQNDLEDEFFDFTKYEAFNSIPSNCVVRTVSPSGDRVARVDFQGGDYIEIKEEIALPILRSYLDTDHDYSPANQYEVALPNDIHKKAWGMNKYQQRKKGTMFCEDANGRKTAEVLQKFSVRDVKECISMLERVRSYLIYALNERKDKKQPDYDEWSDLTSSVTNRVGELMGFKTGEILCNPDADIFNKHNTWYHFLPKRILESVGNDELHDRISEIEETITGLREGIVKKNDDGTVFLDVEGRIK